MRELEVNLRLRKNFDHVNAGFLSSFFNLVPNVYLFENQDVLLNFSEAEFDANNILRSNTRFESTFVYGTSQLLFEKLNEFYGKVRCFHSGSIFLDSIAVSNDPVIHLNLYEHNLEVAVMENSGVVFYNLFETQTGEDILFYTLFAMEQLNLYPNHSEIKCYGQLLPGTKVFQTLKKYVRFVSAGSRNEDFLENHTLFNLPKCASSQALSEARK